MRKFIYLLSFFALPFGVNAQQSDFQMPGPSPEVKISQRFSTSVITLDYSRPSRRGRLIFGDLIPYDQLWRTGANECTRISFGEDVDFGGIPVAAGTYALYSVPGRTSWQLILNTATDNWGLSGYDASQNVASVTVPVSMQYYPVETFNMGIENITDTTCDLILEWDKVKVTVPIVAHNDSLITANLEEMLAGPRPPYEQAANYYYSRGKKLNDALLYVNKAIAHEPRQFYLYGLKARILTKMGRHDEALKVAKATAKMAKGTPYQGEYERDYNLLKSGKKF